jgi:hypothetical protein
MNKQTAVEWFQKEMLELEIKRDAKGVTVGEFAVQYFQLFEQAKVMERQQIINAVDGFPIEHRNLDGSDYYTQTFTEQP